MLRPGSLITSVEISGEDFQLRSQMDKKISTVFLELVCLTDLITVIVFLLVLLIKF